MGQKVTFLLGLCIILGLTISGATALDAPYSLSGHVYDNGSNPIVGVNITFTNLNSSEIIYCDSTAGGEYQQDAANFALGYSDGDNIQYYSVYGVYTNTTTALINTANGGTLLDIYLPLSLTQPSVLMTSVEWLNSITDLFSLFGILIIVAITSLIIYILISKESVGSDLLIAMAKTIIIVGVILFIGVVIFTQLGDL